MALSEHYYMQPRYYSGDDIILDLADEEKPDVIVQRLTSPNNQHASNIEDLKVPYLIPVPVSNTNDIDYEDTYIKNLTIAGQGTIGLELKATKKGIRIALNSNEKLSSDNNAMILDIGTECTYFRKFENGEEGALKCTGEQRALLDIDRDQLYWFSLDKKNGCLRYEKGPMQCTLTVFY